MVANTESVDKRTDSQPTRIRAPVPALWALWGRQACNQERFPTFFAERVCIEDWIEAEPTGPHSVDYQEKTVLYVLYRHPETGEAVERRYQASVIERPDTDAVPVHASHAGECEKVDYPGIRMGDDSRFVALPKCVFDGEPWNFRASIDVSPTETRVDA